jgi:ABC-type multidrug transport system fused ATPase/permease subunit
MLFSISTPTIIRIFRRYPSRPDTKVLSNFSLRAKPGQVVALCGESGGGKSSCVALLERFYQPIKGRLLLDGVDISTIEPASYHRKVALVGQEPVLYGRSIRENILFGFMASTCEDMPDQAAVEEAARQVTYILSCPSSVLFLCFYLLPLTSPFVLCLL